MNFGEWREGKAGIAVEKRWRVYIMVMEEVGECLMYWLGRWQRMKQLYG